MSLDAYGCRLTRPAATPPSAFLLSVFLLLCRSEKAFFPVPSNPVPSNPVPSNPVPSNRWSPRSAWRLIPYTRPSGSGRGRPLFDRPKRGRSWWMRRKPPPGTRSRAFARDARPDQEPASPPAPASPPGGIADHRASSILAFLCSCFAEGLWDQGLWDQGLWDQGLWAETGQSTMFCLTARGVLPMGKSQYPGVAIPSLSLSRG